MGFHVLGSGRRAPCLATAHPAWAEIGMHRGEPPWISGSELLQGQAKGTQAGD